MSDFPQISELDEARGWARANRVVTFAILKQMQRKGLLTEDETHQILDLALSALEASQMKEPSDQSLIAARDVLEGMMEHLCPPKRPG